MSVPYRVVLLEVIGGLLLGVTPDLPDEDDALGLWVLQEYLQTVDEVRTVERIASDTWRKTRMRKTMRMTMRMRGRPN